MGMITSIFYFIYFFWYIIFLVMLFADPCSCLLLIQNRFGIPACGGGWVILGSHLSKQMVTSQVSVVSSLGGMQFSRLSGAFGEIKYE